MDRPFYWVETADGGVRPATREEGHAAMDDLSRVVGQDEENGLTVSTVFLIMDAGHNRAPNAAPMLYETMIFGAEDVGGGRYHTRAQAAEGHAAACRQHLGREPSGSNGG